MRLQAPKRQLSLPTCRAMVMKSRSPALINSGKLGGRSRMARIVSSRVDCKLQEGQRIEQVRGCAWAWAVMPSGLARGAAHYGGMRGDAHDGGMQ